MTYGKSVTPPSSDKRWRMIDAAMRRCGYHDHALIETLHAVQESFGFLDEVAMRYVGHSLRIPLSKVYGVATFYHLFSLKPHGKHTCVVCLGTACYIKGAGAIMETIGQEYGVEEGETTKDGQLSLVAARCVGTCGLAPVVVYDGDVAGEQTADMVSKRLKEITS